MSETPVPQHSEHLVTFPDGLPGFEATRAFALVSSPALHPFTIVQGVGDGAPSFVAIDPRHVDAGYQAALDDGQRVRLDARDQDALTWLALVNIRQDGEATVNLRAPLVVNPRSARAIQLVPVESSYRLDHPLYTG